MVNFNGQSVDVKLSVVGLDDDKFGPGYSAILYRITGDHPEDENNFDDEKVTVCACGSTASRVLNMKESQ